jgi:hypothetical protein
VCPVLICCWCGLHYKNFVFDMFVGKQPERVFSSSCRPEAQQQGWIQFLNHSNDKKAEMNEFSINFILVMMMSCFECGWLSSIRGLVDPHGWKLEDEKMFQFDLEYNLVIHKEREAQQQQFHHNTKPNANVWNVE